MARDSGIKKYAQKTNLLDEIRPVPTVAILAGAALMLRLFFLRFRYAVAYDEVNYLKLGVSAYLNGLSEVLHTYWSPLLPFLISFFCNFSTDYELAGRMVSVLAGVMLIPAVYLLGKEVYDQRVGVLAAAFTAFFPPLAFQSTLVLTESISMLLAVFCILFGWRMLKQYAVGYAFLSGIFAGLAYLAHPMGIGFFILLVFWLALGTLSRWFLIRPLRLLWLILPLGLSFAAVSAPYLLFLKQATGEWTISTKGSANLQMASPMKSQADSFRAFDPVSKTVPIDQVFHQGTFSRSADDNKNGVRTVQLKPFLFKYFKNFANVLKQGIPQVLTALPLIFMGIGLFGARWEPQQGKRVLFLASFILFYWFLVIPAFHIHLRYFTPLLPVCAVWIARGFGHVHDWLCNYLPLLRFCRRREINASAFSLAMLTGLFLVFSLLPEFGRAITRRADSPDYYADAVEQKRAGLWLREHADGTPIIMSRNHVADFYAGNYNIKQSVTIPTASFDEVLEYARARGVQYLLLNDRYLRDYPQLEFLLSEDVDSDLPHLQRVYKDVDPSGVLTVIYRVLW